MESTTYSRKQAALIAVVVSAAFSWPTVTESPWTVKAVFYASLALALSTVASASQQSTALYRFGQHSDGLKILHNLLARPRRQSEGSKVEGSELVASKMQLYVWQMPVMLLNISITLLIVGLFILIWDRAAHAARSSSWSDDLSVSMVYLVLWSYVNLSRLL